MTIELMGGPLDGLRFSGAEAEKFRLQDGKLCGHYRIRGHWYQPTHQREEDFRLSYRGSGDEPQGR